MKTNLQNSLMVLAGITAIYLLWQFSNSQLCVCNEEKTHDTTADQKQKASSVSTQKEQVTDKSVEKSEQLPVRKVVSSIEPVIFRSQNPDLIKWGTKEGIIDVANRFDDKMKEKKRIEGIKKESAAITQVYRAAKKAQFHAKGIAVNSEAKLDKALSKDLQTTQFTISNNSDKSRPISLWNANRTTAISPPLPEDLAELHIENTTIVGGVHPSAVVFNPANNLVYVANQLSDSISVFDQRLGIIKIIKLTESLMPGSFSPTDLAVNSNRKSTFFGHVYVTGSVAGQVLEIDPAHQIQRSFTVGIRPLKLLYNASNDCLYISDLAGNSVVIIDLESGKKRDVPSIDQPYDLAINKAYEVVITSWMESSLYKILPDNSTIHFDQLTESVTQIEYQPEENSFYLNSPNTNEIITIDADSLQLQQVITVDKAVISLHYSPFNELVYLLQKDQLAAISEGQILPEKLNVDSDTDQIFSNPLNGNLYTTSQQSAKLNLYAFNEQSSQIIADEQLAERAKEFQNKPVVVHTARIFVSNPENLQTIKLVSRSSSGAETSRIVSLTSSQSPQHLRNIIDLPQMHGASIDGQNAWEFELPSNQSITFLVAYRQFDSYYLLPKTG